MSFEKELREAIEEGDWVRYERILSRINPDPPTCSIIGEDGWKGTLLTSPPRDGNRPFSRIDPYPENKMLSIHWDNGVVEHMFVRDWNHRSVSLKSLHVGDRVVRRDSRIIRWKMKSAPQYDRVGWWILCSAFDWSRNLVDAANDLDEGGYWHRSRHGSLSEHLLDVHNLVTNFMNNNGGSNAP